MKKKKHILFILLLLFATLLLSRLLLSCGNPGFDTAFQNFTEELFRKELSSNTISLHYTLQNPENYELTNCPISYGNISYDTNEALSSVETTLTSLEVFDSVSLSEENRLTYDILHAYLKMSIEGSRYLLYQEPLGSVSGVHTQLPILLSEFPFCDTDDVTTYLQLLKQTDAYFSEIMNFEQKKVEHGSFMPDYQIDLVIDYCRTFVNMGSVNPLFTSFQEKINSLSLTEKETDDFISQNQSILQDYVFPAYESLISKLQTLKGCGTNEMGLCYFPDGKEYFSYLIKQETGLSKTVEELQEMTYKQISEDLFAIEQTLATSNFVTDDSILSATPASMLDDLKTKTTSQFPTIPDVDTEIKYVSSAMEEFLSPAFYMIPAIDDHEENVIYINPGQTLYGLNLYTTLAHEGYPGHLYQTVYFSSQDPDPIRSILHFGGYVEGWATYGGTTLCYILFVHFYKCFQFVTEPIFNYKCSVLINSDFLNHFIDYTSI